MSTDSESRLLASVVVATYASGPELDDLVASLDAQTLDTQSWEAVFVDDGSPDGTLDRLLDFARTRPHFRVERIENSGWPCRPRNVGLDLARGEYVAFMDHDDELYPDALRAGTAFAIASGADVLNGKEARTSDPAWALTTYERDRAQVLGDATVGGALSPMNPHKLYRRDFLNEHGIRFRDEGRVLWEDVFFNLLVLSHADVVSTMARTPYYHWRTTTGSGSTTFRRAKAEWWYWFTEILTRIEIDLAGAHHEEQRELLRGHQYRTRLLDAFGDTYPRRASASRKLIFEQARHLQSTFFPDDEGMRLTSSERLRAHLLRIGHPHAMHRLIEEDAAPARHASLLDASWSDGVLTITHTGNSSRSKGSTVLRRQGDRIIKVLPEPLMRLFDESLCDATDEIRNQQIHLAVCARTDRLAWALPSTARIHESDSSDGTVDVSVSGSSTLTPATAALGSPLHRDVWELHAIFSQAGTPHAVPLRAQLTPVVTRTDLGVCAVYADAEHQAVIDIDQSGEPLTALCVPNGKVLSHGGDKLFGLTLSSLGEGADVQSELPLSTATGAALRRQFRAARRGVDPRVADRNWRIEAVSICTIDGAAWLRVPAAQRGDDVIAAFGARLPDSGGLFRLGTDSVRRVATRR